MAITWNVKIIPIDIPTKEASIVATRIDDADSSNPRVYTLSSWTLSNTITRLLALDRIWEMHQAALTLETNVTNFLVGLEGQAKSNLEARE